ncbi:type II toxin-antitoxin system VapB family antitoxin [Inquilinus sp. CAU 1745]|uniref:type II toxin-antitoxin system VapB family antitoxin n=1 Tax=Inquilinus sp. CAU 1745 TaxID=3140369 RepID=UPI00325B72A9
MPLYVKDPEVDRLAREIARLEHKSLTEVLGDALRERYSALMRPEADRRARADAALRKIRRMPVIDRRDADSVFYDDSGLPR